MLHFTPTHKHAHTNIQRHACVACGWLLSPACLPVRIRNMKFISEPIFIHVYFSAFYHCFNTATYFHVIALCFCNFSAFIILFLHVWHATATCLLCWSILFRSLEYSVLLKCRKSALTPLSAQHQQHCLLLAFATTLKVPLFHIF